MLAFAGLLIVMFLGEFGAGVGQSLVGQDIVADIRRDLVRKIILAPIDQLEQTERHRLIAALTADVGRISGFIRGLAYLIVASCEAAACAIYMAYLSWPMFCAVALVGVANYLGIRAASRLAYARYMEERQSVDNIQKSYQALIDGAKELRLNRRLRYRFFYDQIATDIERIRAATNSSSVGSVLSVALDSASFFIMAGALIGLSAWLDKSELAQFILILMYLKGPVGQIVLSLPTFDQSLISFKNVAELSQRLRQSEEGLLGSQSDSRTLGAFESLECRGLRFAFPVKEEVAPFVLGPIDLRVNAGETIFIVGENGSGKTTLIKVLLGIYPSPDGQIFLNGVCIDDSNRDHYRQYFSAIFFDFHLFARLTGVEETDEDEVRAHLTRLDIAHKTSFHDGAFSTLDLSAGQRKRLALIVTYLEKRPVVVLDEWAAEQDPTFRRIFYREILPEMKRKGKTLIVVSHDDRYFDAADRILKIKDGKIVEAAAATSA
ncbi:cyclic peptide export ABC transporter [Methylocystis heyeri]|uniref:Cyclic peptide export ABC transporter n=1 Tax=Methylocystis heyeri TaxID=391905 RepID=A0A6B8KGE9_9HYPH|nr:cyclic peptide export ABC transporter [Methylocystis heyeri]